MPRRGSAAARILEQLPQMPFFTAEEMAESTTASSSSVCSAIDRLAAAGILRPLTNRKRSQIWCAAEIIDELEDLGARIADRTRSDPVWHDIRQQADTGAAGTDDTAAGTGDAPSTAPGMTGM